MAAALLNQICGDFFQAQSAGVEPGTLNPLAVEALQEIGIDISGVRTQSVLDVFKSGQLFAYVITVCSGIRIEGLPGVRGCNHTAALAISRSVAVYRNA
jgi:arsenate reductase